MEDPEVPFFGGGGFGLEGIWTFGAPRFSMSGATFLIGLMGFCFFDIKNIPFILIWFSKNDI